MEISKIGLDTSKSVFQVHGSEATGRVVLRKRLRRSEVKRFFARVPPCVVGMEACAAAHYWARELQALGHEPKLMPPSYVKPYVKRGKNDAIDAEACHEAVDRPGMRFVPVKSAEQQAALVPHRVRALLVRQRTMLSNALRAHLSEFGMIAPKGRHKLAELVAVVRDESDARLPALARAALRAAVAQLEALEKQIATVEAEIVAWHKANAASRRLSTIPGVGPITASAIVATVGDAAPFRSARHFAAWLGLVPRQSSTGGKQRLGGVSKMGDRYLRTLLVLGATAMVGLARRTKPPALAWVTSLLERKPARLVTLALANKTARIVWALLTRGGTYRPQGAAA